MYGAPVLSVHRPLSCCLDEVQVSAPPGIDIGTVHENWSWRRNYSVKNSYGETLLKIIGPCCVSCRCCSEIEFKVSPRDLQFCHRVNERFALNERVFFTRVG